jgi:dihydrofolate synthase / folylpolyglutamate synthase
LSDPLGWLFGLEQFGIKFGLDTITAIVDALDHPEQAFRSVHIAGTNGKGSVTALVDAGLRAAGHHAARYTSPHLIDLSERFVIDGRPVDRDVLARTVADVRRAVEDLRDRGRVEVHPTFFEVTTAVAFELFRRAGVEIAVCEVGLGGRLDATNVLRPDVCAITSIGLDHEQYLGHTLRAIALEKAGIIKPGVPVVAARMNPEALEAIASVAHERNAPLVDASETVWMARDGSSISVRTERRDYGTVVLGLRGDHQADNAAVAVRLLELIDERGCAVSTTATVDALEHASWPGRLDIRRTADGREALLDAAHNPDGAAALAQFLRGSPFENAPLVFAAMRDKNVDSMLRALLPVVGHVVVTRASHARSGDPAELAARIRAAAPGTPVTTTDSASDALEAAWRISPRIVVAGSIFLLGDVMKEAGWS